MRRAQHSPPCPPRQNRNSGKPKSKKQFVLTCSRFIGRVSCSGSPVIGVPRRQSGRLQKASPKPLYLIHTLQGPFLQRGPRAISVPHRQSDRLQKASPKPLYLIHTLQGPFLHKLLFFFLTFGHTPARASERREAGGGGWTRRTRPCGDESYLSLFTHPPRPKPCALARGPGGASRGTRTCRGGEI